MIVYIGGMKPTPRTYRFLPGTHDKLVEFANDFTSRGFALFGEEFAELDAYIEEANKDRSNRDDHTLRRSAKELYLIEAVAYAIYDKINRAAFNAARNTLIVLPDCLSLHNPDCIKSDEEFGDICQLCTLDCQAAEICEVAGLFGVEVVFSKRALSDQLKHYADQSGDLAVIGVGCLMMLAGGMRTAYDLNIPARGVPLDFAGCEHWNDEPFASKVDVERIRAILEEKYEPGD